MVVIEKIVIVKMKTWLEELIEKFNTKSQAKFYIEHMGSSFEDYEDAHNNYHDSLDKLKKIIPKEYKRQIIEKSFLPNFLFGPKDLVIVIGQDGLVINTAKYLDDQLIVAVNPDPKRFDGILIPFDVDDVPSVLRDLMNNKHAVVPVTMVQAKLNNGQVLYGVNDLFIGHKAHGSAKYTIKFLGSTEQQSSSGIIVSTGAGSTGWFRSVLTGAFSIISGYENESYGTSHHDYRFPWDANYVYFSVREPFISKTSGANIIFGKIQSRKTLILESKMPENGVIFSDGIQEDYIEFNSGAIAEICIADRTANIVVKKRDSWS
ncbi:MAG: sugar kinase [Candidatus Heimdallarchaeota archaeon]